MAHRWQVLVPILAFGAGFLIHGALRAWTAPEQAPPPFSFHEELEGQRQGIDDLRRGLLDIERAIAELDTPRKRALLPIEAEPTRRPVAVDSESGDEHGELREMLEGLGVRLASIEGALESGMLDPGPPIHVVKGATPSPNWAALENLWRAWKQDEEAAKASVRFLTYEEVLNRFGAPDRVGRKTMWTWFYERDRQQGPPGLVMFGFSNGYVVNSHAGPYPMNKRAY